MPRSSASPKHHGRVIVVGASNTDLVVHCPKLPQPGESVLGGDLLTFAGGKGANQAVAAARAGAKAYFIGAFGDDAFGRARRADLEKEGVDCSGCVVKKGVPSGMVLIAIGEGKGKERAENLIFVAPGANRRLTPDDVKKAMPKDLDIDDVLLCSLEVPLPSVVRAIRLANRVGATVVLNPAPFPAEGLPDALVKGSNLIVPNEVEFLQLLGVPPGSAVAKRKLLRFFTGGSGHCTGYVVTRGAKGVAYHFLYRDGKGEPKGPAFEDAAGVLWTVHGPSGRSKLGTELFSAPKVKPVDTVGAGDCFNGCLAARLVEDRFDVEGAIRFAVAAAALKVTRHGAQAGLPYRAEILKMMRTKGFAHS